MTNRYVLESDPRYVIENPLTDEEWKRILINADISSYITPSVSPLRRLLSGLRSVFSTPQ